MKIGEIATQTIKRFNDLAAIYSKELSSIIENARWLVTLIVAEIAGLAAYRQMGDATTLSLPFTVIVFILAGSLLCFIVSVILSSRAESNLRKYVATKISQLEKEQSLSETSEASITKFATEMASCLSNTMPDFIRTPEWFEKVGLIIFLMASVIGGFIVISYELLDQFFKTIGALFGAS